VYSRTLRRARTASHVSMDAVLLPQYQPWEVSCAHAEHGLP